jgi:hypothetical protein
MAAKRRSDSHFFVSREENVQNFVGFLARSFGILKWFWSGSISAIERHVLNGEKIECTRSS